MAQRPVGKIAAEAGADEVAEREVGLGAVVESGAGRDITRVHGVRCPAAGLA